MVRPFFPVLLFLRYCAAACVFASLLPDLVGAQAADTLPRPVYRAVARTEPVRVDGRLTEGDWGRAPVATDFIQREPNPGVLSAHRTEVRVLFDDGSLYVGARMFDKDPASIPRQLARRDEGDAHADVFHVGFDSYFDRRTAFRFSVTASGVQLDGFHFNDNNEDGSWDAVWESATAIDSLGWTAELRIPLSQLRYGAVSGSRRWGVEFARESRRDGEMSFWSPVPPTASGIVSRFGDLVGIDALPVPQRLEVVPYVSSQLTARPNTEVTEIVGARETSARIGADIRYGLPRGFTLTATINPDFGQVEVDPAVVNLTAFETFFQERRPFFQEGFDIFRFGGTVTFNDNDPPQPFYTRRIGRAPRGRVSGSEVVAVDLPQQTDILGAAKVSGKTADGWSLGILGALTSREDARWLDDAGQVLRYPVEPQTSYGVGRLARDFRDGNTTVGVALTGVRRQMSDEFRSLLPSASMSGGLSWEHAWQDRAWTASGYVATSRVSGDSRFISALQRSNTHVFQRPDQDRVRFDSTRTALSGHFWSASLARTAGQHWLGSVTYEETSPGYDVNDLGFQRRSDMRSFGSAIRYRETRAQSWYRQWNANINHTIAWNFDSDVLANRVSGVYDVDLRNFWSVTLIGAYTPRVYNDRLTRGGPLARNPADWFTRYEVSTDERRPVFFELEYGMDGNDAGQRSHQMQFGIIMRPSSALQVGIGPNIELSKDPAQFVTAVRDPLAVATAGRRYVFGDLTQREVSIETRLEWTFSPTLSLQVFAQPFVSSGRFDTFKEFRTPRAFEFDVYGRDRGTIVRDRANEAITIDPDGAGAAPAFRFDEQDFTVRSVRGNAVVRWEYRPGSTLFFVWQQARESEAVGADLSAALRPTAAFRGSGRNVFLLKASYWLGR